MNNENEILDYIAENEILDYIALMIIFTPQQDTKDLGLDKKNNIPSK